VLSNGDAHYLGLIATIDEWLLDQLKPDIFDHGDPRNVLVLARKRFGAACAALAEAGYPRAQELTVFDFNAAVDFLMSKQKQD
jgi:hypothetical protein